MEKVKNCSFVKKDNKKIFFLSKNFALLQFFLIFSFMVFLKKTDSYYSIYLLLSVLGTASVVWNTWLSWAVYSTKKIIIYGVISFLISFSAVVANYSIWKAQDILLNRLVMIILVLLGGMSALINILFMLDDYVNKRDGEKPGTKWLNTKIIAGFTFFIVAVLDLSFLFTAEYPGVLTTDSLNQVGQILTGNYTNHHPYYHTMLIKFWLKLGIWLFGDANIGVLFYSVFQILFVSAGFTYCVVTLYQAGASKLFIVLLVAYFALMPYHIAYSVTMWKDISFGIAVLVLLVSLFRIFLNIGKARWVNFLVLAFASMGTCLWRSNGWMAFAVSVVVFAILLLKRYKTVFIIMLSTLLLSVIMIFPALSIMKVPQPDTIESLSIPTQQIARVVTDCNDLSKKECDLLNKIIDVNEIPGKYKSHISDPIKDLVRAKGNQEFLKANKTEYFKLWIALGVRHPAKYVEAWVDQTRGYWNGGYKYWIKPTGIGENDFGLKSRFEDSKAKQLFVRYCTFTHSDVFDVFRSIGFITWIILISGGINLANGRITRAFLTVPLLAIIATLCLGTPVFSEFRYAYSLFTCVPLIIFATFNYNFKGEADNG